MPNRNHKSPATDHLPLATSGFTLVEMLVVIIIIGMLAGLIMPAVIGARKRAKIAAVGIELNQLDAALKAYKEKYGEYPPDFAGIDSTLDTDTTSYPVRTAARTTVLRHLARAFPRYVPGVSTGSATLYHTWDGFQQDVFNGWGVNANYLTPANALTFWLGGRPDWFTYTLGTYILPVLPSNGLYNPDKPIRGFTGFSANPLNPFDNSDNRIRSLYEFSPDQVAILNTAVATSRCWPKSAMGERTWGSLVYFRAQNNAYFAYTATNIAIPKVFIDDYDTESTAFPVVYPAIDTRTSRVVSGVPQYTWVNPTSFQILSSGLDLLYATPKQDATTAANSLYPSSNYMARTFGLITLLVYVGPYEFPSGANYGSETRDDITNFSGGRTLEDAIEQ